MAEYLHNPKAIELWKGKAMLDGLRKAILGESSDIEVFAFHRTIIECNNSAFCAAQKSILKTLPYPSHFSAQKRPFKKSAKIRSKKLMLREVV